MKTAFTALMFTAASAAYAQDQQVGARAKAMGGSYTAFEDDPISVWLNPAGIATQPDGMAVAYQSYTIFEPTIRPGTEPTAPGEFGWTDPALIPSYLGAVFQLGTPENPHAVGLCFAQPFRMKLVYLQSLAAQLDQTFYRFRAAYAHDFRFSPQGTEGLFTHLSVGVGADLSVTRWHYQEFVGDPSVDPPPQDLNFNDAGLGGGAGLLLGVYDNTRNFKVNFGAAYQSAANYDFSVDQELIPVFDWPTQFNAGFTFYLLEEFPLRLTTDAQFIGWDTASADDAFGQGRKFNDVFNYSLGAEYRVKVGEKNTLFPRAGFRIYQAPWDDVDALPRVGNAQLVIEPKKSTYNIFSLGTGLQWESESGKLRTVDVALDFGGETPGFAFSFTMEF